MFQVGNDWNSSGIVRLWDTLDTRFWNGISYFFAYLISMLCPKIGGQLPSTRLKASRSSKCGDYDNRLWVNLFQTPTPGHFRGTFVAFWTWCVGDCLPAPSVARSTPITGTCSPPSSMASQCRWRRMDGGDWLVIPEVNPQKSPWML